MERNERSQVNESCNEQSGRHCLHRLLVPKVRIGAECADRIGWTCGDILELVEGSFEHWNGLYDEVRYAPAVWDDNAGEYCSIYHLFGNDLSDFLGCERKEKAMTKDNNDQPTSDCNSAAMDVRHRGRAVEPYAFWRLRYYVAHGGMSYRDINLAVERGILKQGDMPNAAGQTPAAHKETK